MSAGIESNSLGYMKSRRWAYLGLLFLVATSAAADRHVVSILLEPIRKEFALSDTMLGLITGLGFTLVYSTAGLPIARWADRSDRRVILTIAITIWSAMTIVCGVVHSVWQLLIARLGVGLGEAGALPLHNRLSLTFSLRKSARGQWPSSWRRPWLAICSDWSAVRRSRVPMVGERSLSCWDLRACLLALLSGPACAIPGWLQAKLRNVRKNLLAKHFRRYGKRRACA
ncbi:hypothetical protein C7W88_18195 (plasmid) [Novosphingobium sp. THN1]|nr:hypothetical protein C7W88_18195 [Novosphingobium sp. THN1]